jgi:negative regulator of sigma E activity
MGYDVSFTANIQIPEIHHTKFSEELEALLQIDGNVEELLSSPNFQTLDFEYDDEKNLNITWIYNSEPINFATEFLELSARYMNMPFKVFVTGEDGQLWYWYIKDKTLHDMNVEINEEFAF